MRFGFGIYESLDAMEWCRRRIIAALTGIAVLVILTLMLFFDFPWIDLLAGPALVTGS